ncbi:MAG TPA: histidine--tRNA ligase [Firmicutes bacterium]|nr:histidine--tRNA ligase [Bacillota bacterium]
MAKGHSFTRVRGTQDVLPEESRLWRYVEDTIRELCRIYHYGEIRTPIFEHTELFLRTGEATDIVDKQMYTFTDRGGRSLTLRPEGTAPVARAYLEAKERPLLPFKVYYLGPMFRYERPQGGRLRQFTQFGIEAIGSADPALDAEVIGLGWEVFRRLGLEGLTIHLNSIGCPACRPRYREALVAYYRQRASGLCPDCQRRLEVNPLRLLDCKEATCREAAHGAPVTVDYLCEECRTHFTAVQELLDRLSIPFVLDPYLVRGLDYYTRTVFEIMHGSLGAQNTVCAGGRYDGLVEVCGGETTPGIGFAAGLERLLATLDLEGKQPPFSPPVQVLVVGADAEGRRAGVELLHSLRRAGVAADIDYLGRSLKAQMKHAARLGVQTVVILGQEEVQAGEVTLRDMVTGEQRRIPSPALIEELQRKGREDGERG